MTTLPWTDEQLLIYDQVEDTSLNLLIEAVAGSGKTTTLIEAVRYLKGSTLTLAFNVKVKKELEKRLGDTAVCLTLNGCGHRALMKFLGRGFPIDAYKVGKLTKEILKEHKQEERKPIWHQVRGLVSKAKASGLVHKDSPGMFITSMKDTEENWENIAAHYDIEFTEEILERAREVLLYSTLLALRAESVDFDDQIYIPTIYGAPFQSYNNVLVDEVQDLSLLQHKMLSKIVKNRTRLIAVGDTHQSIYGFRNADSESIPNLVKQFKLKSLSLTVSFRCAQEIIARAQRIVPQITALPAAPVGVVRAVKEYSDTTFADTGDAIVCRNNAPLIKLAYRLISRGRGVHMIGRDIGAGLKTLVKKLSQGNDFMPVEEVLVALKVWQSTQEASAMNKEKFDQVERIIDKADSLRAVVEYTSARTAGDLILEIDTMFGRESAPITLTSIHQAKGMEWHRVFFLDKHLLPSKWTMKSYNKNPERYAWMLQQERNLEYVTITRAKEELLYIDTKGWK